MNKMKNEKELINDANELIRSFASVCDRYGQNTNWKALRDRVTLVLKEQHRYMYPEQYEANGERKGKG